MRLPSIISRAVATLSKATEGAPRPGPWSLPITGAWLPANVGDKLNWWQLGYSPSGYAPSAIVERCISLFSTTVASLPGAHWRRNALGGRTRVENSALARILKRPNAYQSPSDFINLAVRSLYTHGNAYALARRNDRYEIDELHPMDARQSQPCLIGDDGDVFYALGGNAIIERILDRRPLVVPARDVLHIRLHPREGAWPYPLIGESPLSAATADVTVGNAFIDSQLEFLRNQSRPSAVLSTDMVLDRNQTQQLRDAWNEQAKGIHAGGTPILTSGLKVQPWNVAPKDAQIAELMKMSAERICFAFGIPLQLIGLASGPIGSTEALMQFWLKTSLGFTLNHVEQTFDRLFRLKGEPEEYCEFDVEALLRAAPKDHVDMLARGVQGGIYSPNEARHELGFDSVPYGAEPRVQQQVVPLSAAAAIEPAIPPAPGPSAPLAAKQLTDHYVKLLGGP